MQNTISRKDLYELIWTTSISQISEKWRVNRVYITKLCIKHDIPRPPNGYWAMNRKPSRTPLLGNPEKTLEYHTDIVSVMSQQNKNINLEDDIRKIDKNLKASYRYYLKAGLSYNLPYKELLSKEIVPIKVSDNKEVLKRAFLMLDYLFKVFKERGWSYRYDRNEKIIITVDGEDVPLILREGLMKQEKAFDEKTFYRTSFIPSGSLSITVGKGYACKKIRDTRTLKLETRLGTIVNLIKFFSEKSKSLKKEMEDHNKDIKKLGREFEHKLTPIANTFSEYSNLVCMRDHYKVRAHEQGISSDKIKQFLSELDAIIAKKDPFKNIEKLDI